MVREAGKNPKMKKLFVCTILFYRLILRVVGGNYITEAKKKNLMETKRPTLDMYGYCLLLTLS